MPNQRRVSVAVAALAAAALAACSSSTAGSSQSAAHSPSASSVAPSVPSTPPPSTGPTTPPAPSTTAPTTSASPTPPPAALPQLPLGGRAILGHYRIVAYYGGPDGPALGVLGSQQPEQIAAAIAARGRQWAAAGRLPVQPAMELIATVAQGSAGPYGLWSAPISDDDVQRYLDVAHRNKMLLILDFQPGRGEFLPQVQHFARFLTDPSVEVALDPEWKMGPGEIPGRVIGSSSAASVLAVRDYLAGVVRAKHLPDKLLMVHQFTLPMLPDRWRIRPVPGIEIVFHADGFGSQGAKNATWNRMAFPGRPFGTGFKLFLRQDIGLMTPAQVLARHPVPDVITYQ